ncbi:hypothetical protein RV12_GL002792 [Enterococcus quebecensis]|nr:hypothetical protein RV12_GL002792 [Enterococcus quebecensis]
MGCFFVAKHAENHNEQSQLMMIVQDLQKAIVAQYLAKRSERNLIRFT